MQDVQTVLLEQYTQFKMYIEHLVHPVFPESKAYLVMQVEHVNGFGHVWQLGMKDEHNLHAPSTKMYPLEHNAQDNPLLVAQFGILV